MWPSIDEYRWCVARARVFSLSFVHKLQNCTWHTVILYTSNLWYTHQKENKNPSFSFLFFSFRFFDVPCSAVYHVQCFTLLSVTKLNMVEKIKMNDSPILLALNIFQCVQCTFVTLNSLSVFFFYVMPLGGNQTLLLYPLRLCNCCYCHGIYIDHIANVPFTRCILFNWLKIIVFI